MLRGWFSVEFEAAYWVQHLLFSSTIRELVGFFLDGEVQKVEIVRNKAGEV